jgi:putative metalloprotease
MKKSLILSTVLLSVAFASCTTLATNTKALEAAGYAVSALTLSDADVIAMTREFMVRSDTENQIPAANNAYATRLKKLTDPFVNEAGLKLNFKVYLTKDVNAFATADGSVRVYSGLMDIMSDAELAAVIGHEIGHVNNDDVKDAARTAYVAAAATSAVGATGRFMESLSNSQYAQLANALVSAQYSQKQESQADDYGFAFAVKYGYGPYAMARALEKLNQAAGTSATADAVSQLFSSHPDAVKRAARMRQKGDEYTKTSPK